MRDYFVECVQESLHFDWTIVQLALLDLLAWAGKDLTSLWPSSCSRKVWVPMSRKAEEWTHSHGSFAPLLPAG